MNGTIVLLILNKSIESHSAQGRLRSSCPPAAVDAETAVAPSTIHPPDREKIGCRDYAPVLPKRNLQAERSDAHIGKKC
jgi:hypothetical protein